MQNHRGLVGCLIGLWAMFLLSCSAEPDTHNVLAKQEKKEGWRLLFDGKTTKGWHVYNKGDTASAWEIMEGELWCDPSIKLHGDLVTDSLFENFDLQFEWKVEEGGNSGVMINVQEGESYSNTHVTGPEYQLLDNENSTHRNDSAKMAGSLYGVVPVKGASKPKPYGEWNQSRIVQQAGRIVFTLNGIVTCDVQLGSEEWQALLAKSSLQSYPDYGKKWKGHIALQNHNHEVSFRALKIRRL